MQIHSQTSTVAPLKFANRLFISSHPLPNMWLLDHAGIKVSPWASCQIRKIAGAYARGMPGTFSPSPQVSDPDMHHGTWVTHVPWYIPGSLTSGFLWKRRRGKTFPAFPAHAQPAILRIWQEVHVIKRGPFGSVRCGHAPYILFILLPTTMYIWGHLSYIHEWEGRQKIKQAHHTSVPSDCGIGPCKFHAAAGPGTRVSFICVAQYSPNHKALTCKNYNRVKSRVSNERTEAEIMSNFLHLNIGLAQDYGIPSLELKYRSQLDHEFIYDLLNLVKLGSYNGFLPEGNWTPNRLCTFADYSWVIIKDTLWHLTWFHWKCKI